jgi:uncharacterized protein DUF6176
MSATQVICKRIKLKPGSLALVREWAQTLNHDRRDEALATLRDEGVTVESAFLDHAEDGDYLVAYMRSPNLDQAVGAAATSRHSIDAYHQEFKKATWESRRVLETLVDLAIEDEV